MRVGIGYSEHPDTDIAGSNAAQRALENAGRSDPCDFVLMFSTSYHDSAALRDAVAGVLGQGTPIIGGGAIGVITNDRYGYAGEQMGLAAFWMDGLGFDLFAKGGLVDNEIEVGERLGVRMRERGVEKTTPSILFYDAVNWTGDRMRLNLATPLLQGLKKSLGFLPDYLVGAGLQADFEGNPYRQWVGRETVEHYAMMLTLNGDVRVDSIIMHGCRPAGDYYTVTKAEGQTILEIDGQPALPYIESQLQPSLPAEAFPFFMIFGINRCPGEKYQEKNYANRLCLDIDTKRNGIVMFESDMVAGTKFQIMYRSLDLEYIPPRIEHLFKSQEDREAVFAMYIDCAGRAARYGAELEDAVVVQKAVNGRAPLLGIYSGVEIGPIMGEPRTLDWTGVFSLVTIPKK